MHNALSSSEALLTHQAVCGDSRPGGQEHQVSGHQERGIDVAPLAVALHCGEGLEGGLEGGDGVTGLCGLIPSRVRSEQEETSLRKDKRRMDC